MRFKSALGASSAWSSCVRRLRRGAENKKRAYNDAHRIVTPGVITGPPRGAEKKNYEKRGFRAALTAHELLT